jgi:hypothetical protein
MGQPLYVPGVTVGSLAYNLILVGTLNNTIYAFNADNPSQLPTWQLNFGATWASPFSVNCCYSNNIGILSTMATDGTYLYLVTVNDTPTYTLRKVSLATGLQVASATISGSVTGTGAGTVGGETDTTSGSSLLFNAAFQTQRAALTLANGNVYLGFGAGDESKVWHGWIMSYDTASLTQQAIWCSTPNGNGGGAWNVQGFAVDGSGNIYASTGNGSWDGSTSFSQSVLKFNSSLVMEDWFTPSNESTSSAADADLSSGSVMLIPSTSLLTLGSKDGRVWVIDTGNMGHLQGSGAAPQVFNSATVTEGSGTGVFGGAFFQSNGYFPIASQSMNGFAFSGSTYTTAAFASTSPSFAQVALTGTSNGGSNPILWAVTIDSSGFSTERQATLRALNPATLAQYWATDGSYGAYSKFAPPTVANGRVYVPTFGGSLLAFGLP